MNPRQRIAVTTNTLSGWGWVWLPFSKSAALISTPPRLPVLCTSLNWIGDAPFECLWRIYYAREMGHRDCTSKVGVVSTNSEKMQFVQRSSSSSSGGGGEMKYSNSHLLQVSAMRFIVQLLYRYSRWLFILCGILATTDEAKTFRSGSENAVTTWVFINHSVI